jgi:hypothetical protein
MASSKPFVVSSLSTTRYAPSKKTPVKKIPPISPPTSTKERLSVTRGAPTKQTSRPYSVPTVVSKTASKVMSMPAPTKVQKSLPLPLVPSTGYPLPSFVTKSSSKVVLRFQEGKLMGGCPAPAVVTRRSTQVTTANDLPPRPSCVPRSRIYQSSVSVVEASKGNQGVTVKVSITGPHNPGTARQKLSVNIGMPKTAGRVNVPYICGNPVIAGDCRAGTQIRNRRLTSPKPIVYPQAVGPTSYVAWSPPASPDLSSFPSQSWTIVADVDVEPIKTPTTMCGDETLSSMDDAPKSLLSSPTVIQTLASPAEPTVGSDSMAKISSPTKGLSADSEVSHVVGAASIISPSRDGTASMATLVEVMDRSQASSSPTKSSDTGHRTLMTVRCAIEIARTLFSPSRRVSQSSTETTAPKTMGTNVSRIRKLFTPLLDEDVKASKNPTTQMEIEMLRARKKVAGGGLVDPRLDRLGSLAAMAIVTKHGTSGSDVPGQV